MIERLHFPFSLSCIGEGTGNPLQCSCLENPRDGGARWAAICGVTQSRTRLKRLSSSSSSSSLLPHKKKDYGISKALATERSLGTLVGTMLIKEWIDRNAAAAAAKSLQSCPTLCNPTDSSPPGFPVPGILQARTLEWVAISFSNA